MYTHTDANKYNNYILINMGSKEEKKKRRRKALVDESNSTDEIHCSYKTQG
jgi:hypothetical protein